MKNINETEFEKEFEKIKNSKIELKPIKQKQGEKTMKNLKKVNYKKIIETVKTIIIYTAVVAGVAFYLGMKHGENNAKIQNDKIAETVQNLNVKKQLKAFQHQKSKLRFDNQASAKLWRFRLALALLLRVQRLRIGAKSFEIWLKNMTGTWR